MTNASRFSILSATPHARTLCTFLGSMLLVFASGCGVEHLPAPSAPPREVPKDLDLPTEPPARGEGRVVIDAHGDKAKVIEITGSATAAAGNYRATFIGIRPICTTPCVVDLPYGSHPLVLRSTTDETRISEVDLDVGPKPKVMVHTLGERKGGGAANTIGSTLLVLAVTTAVTGAILWGTGAAVSTPESPSSLTGPGQLLTGIGALGVGLSIPLLILGRPSERPGATTQWSVPGATPHELGVPAQGVSTKL